MEYTPKDIYIFFRKSQANFLTRPWRMPKDWDKFFENMAFFKKKNLLKATEYFNTLWMNINPEKYFGYGFELFGKHFSYHKFFDRRLMNLYKEKMRTNELKDELALDTIKSSIKFIGYFMEKCNCKTLVEYIRCVTTGTGLIPAILIHWRRKQIDPFTLIFLMIRYKEEFKEYKKDIADLYLGKDFIQSMYKWRVRLLDNEDVLNYLKKEVPKLEKI